MIGNDIVDIQLARQQSNWQRPRYLDKIFTCQEQEYIRQSTLPEQMVWRLWSMKEAAYKLYVQMYPGRFYNPKAFKCSLSQSEVLYGTFKCHVTTKITSNYIISEASMNLAKMSSEVIKFNGVSASEQSKFLKSKLLSDVAKALHCQRNELQFVKQAHGIPTIEYNQKDINVSLSHHGRYGAMAFAY